MPRKEFELLALLASKPGKVFKRDEILDRVWGNEVVVGGRTIDVHIRKLREKIGDEKFKTVKGVGYKFCYLMANNFRKTYKFAGFTAILITIFLTLILSVFFLRPWRD